MTGKTAQVTFVTHGVIVTSTRLKSPIRRCDEGTDVEIDEEALVLSSADAPQSLLNNSDTLLKSVEVAGS
jgi:hypothetical protein